MGGAPAGPPAQVWVPPQLNPVSQLVVLLELTDLWSTGLPRRRG